MSKLDHSNWQYNMCLNTIKLYVDYKHTYYKAVEGYHIDPYNDVIVATNSKALFDLVDCSAEIKVEHGQSVDELFKNATKRISGLYIVKNTDDIYILSSNKKQDLTIDKLCYALINPTSTMESYDCHEPGRKIFRIQ